MDDHCVNHVCPIELPDYGSSFFIPVDNSLDEEHCQGVAIWWRVGQSLHRSRIIAFCLDTMK